MSSIQRVPLLLPGHESEVPLSDVHVPIVPDQPDRLPGSGRAARQLLPERGGRGHGHRLHGDRPSG